MKRMALLVVAMVMALAASARGHFVFVVPETPKGAAAPTTAMVIMSEDLDPDKDVDIANVTGTQLTVRDAEGKETPLTYTKGEHAMVADLAGKNARIIFGVKELGVRQRGEGKPYLGVYYPKTIIGDAFDAKASVGEKAITEIVPVGAAGSAKLRVLASGKPVAGVEVNIILPDGGKKKYTTNEAGETEALTQTGRYGAWARVTEVTSGKQGDKTYEEVRRYPTLVVDLGSADAKPQAADAKAAGVISYAPMPEPVSSFGGAVNDGWVYVFGGHRIKTHNYSTEAVTGNFYRMNLAEGKAWEELATGPGMQGMNLVAHGGLVYRVGGMQPWNKPGTKSDNHSLADCARFNPATGNWESIAPLNKARSSHDVVAMGNKLIVVGGWWQTGRGNANVWATTAEILDLDVPEPKWQEVSQPFKRRALIAAAYHGKVYVMGGLLEDGEVSPQVDVYDPATNQWTAGIELPGGGGRATFAPAACVHQEQLYVSLGNGALCRFDEGEKKWVEVAQATPRIVHRIVSYESRILIIGGADRKGGNYALIESVNFTPEGVKVETPVMAEASETPAAPADAKPQAAVEAKAQPVVNAAPAPVAAVKEVKTGDAKAAAVATGQKYCPIMTNVEIDPDDNVVVEYAGQKVLLCCSKCAKKWKTDADAYVSKEWLPQLAGKELPKRTLAQVYCPVYKNRVVSEKDPFVTYKGEKVYLFNDQAVQKWNAEPEKYADVKLLPQLAGK